MSSKYHLIFDFDGVIGDTFDILWAVSQQHATDPTLEDFLAHHDGNVYEEPRLQFPMGAQDLFVGAYTERLGPSHVQMATPHIKHLASEYILHIVSSNAEAPLLAVLEESGLRACFASVYGMETHRSKVAKFKMILTSAKLDPSEVLFVTDTLGDVREAAVVGISTIAETFGFHNRERLVQGNPYKIVDTWDEIMSEVETFFKEKSIS